MTAGVAGARSALIVAGDAYTDPGLQRLRAPAADAGALAAVLADPTIGGFEVRTLLNEPAHEVNLAVEEFFADRRPDDLLLLHFSCHGVKDEAGELYFAAANTRLRRLGATAVAAEFVNRRMSRSRSRRVVLLLDCCYAGAFERGMTARAGTGLGIEEQFGGRGRAVITASSAMEYAFEGDELADMGGPTPSVFTSALVAGLETGDADRDQDGLVALDELYDYIYDRVRATTPNQTPSKWVFGVQGDLHIARRSRPVATPAPLPPELQDAIRSPFAGVRAGTVPELARLAQSRHAGLALAARLALEGLGEDDSRTVSTAAVAALGTGPPPPPAPPPLAERAPAERLQSGPAPPSEPAVPPSARDEDDPRLRLAGRLAIGAAALLILALFQTYQYDEGLGLRQPDAPRHVVLLAAAALGAGLCVLLPWTRRMIGPGLLLGLVAAATSGLWALAAAGIVEDGFQIGFWLEIAGFGILALAGGLAGFALAGSRQVHRTRRPGHPLSWLVAVLGAVGAVALAVHTNWLWDEGWGWYAVTYAWTAAVALLLPLWAATVAPRRFAAAVLGGWAVGGMILASLFHVTLVLVRDTVGTSVEGGLIVVFGLALLALLLVAAALARADATPGQPGADGGSPRAA